MKVLYFHQHFSTPAGSAGIRSYEMALRLVREGHCVTMVCGSYTGGSTGLEGQFKNGRREGIVHGIRIIELDLAYSNSDGFIKRSWMFLKYAFRSVGLALSEKYDVVFATTTPLTAGIPGIFARWLRGKPFVFEVRDLWPELPKEMGVIKNPVVLSLMGLLEWCSYRSAHKLIGLSPGIVKGISRLGINHERIKMIPNGCDMDIFASDAKAWRPKGVADGDLMAVFAGTHGVANGLDAVLDAAAELIRIGRHDVKIVLVGSGKMKAHLEKRAAMDGLENVIFHDPVNKEKLAGLMAATDIGLQILANVPAFYYGTSPNKFFDYIAAGLPVLNNYPGWLAEMIDSEKCGFAVSPGNPQAFALALISAADDRGRLAQMGHNARRLAREQFDRQKLSADFVGWLESAARS